MAEHIVCSTCKKRVTNTAGTAVFSCPKCAGGNIVRCFHCREIIAKYTCPKCGFIGPN